MSTPAPAAPITGFPMQLSFPETNEVANWRPLAHWLMVIPHIIVASVVATVESVVTMVAWFAILFTGKLPIGMANVIIMSQRYNNRAGGFLLGLTETYPPFAFDTVATDLGDHDIRFSVQPELEDRDRVTVALRFFTLIPLIIVLYLYQIVIGVLALIAWFAVLFTGSYPEGLRRLVIGFIRFSARISVYGGLLTDNYPSFGLTDP